MIKLKSKDLLKLKMIRYVLLFIALFFGVAFLRVYLASYNINQSIDETKQQKQQKLQEIFFKENYYLRYLNSPYYTYFLRHESRILNEDEKLIHFVYQQPTILKQQQSQMVREIKPSQ